MFLFIIVKVNELKTSHLQREIERLMVGWGAGEGKEREVIILFPRKKEVVL